MNGKEAKEHLSNHLLQYYDEGDFYFTELYSRAKYWDISVQFDGFGHIYLIDKQTGEVTLTESYTG